MSNSLSAPSGPLIDRFGRQVTYLRLSATDRCNLRCIYCMDEEMTFLPRPRILTLEEMLQVARAFVDLGVFKVRLTGGEPLVRNGIVDLCREISGLPGLRELVMTSNGVLLPQYAESLVAAGVRRINISLDSLDPGRFREITRTGELHDVLQGIDAARAAGFGQIKLNAVILRGVNDDEVADLADFALDRNCDISFIEEMPLGSVRSHDRGKTRYQSDWIRDRLGEHFELTPTTESTGGPSRYYRVAGRTARIGFISPISDNFCAGCNRVRVTTEGRLLLCLGNEHSVDLRAVLRSHPGDEGRVQQAIVDAMRIKPERHHFDPEQVEIVRFMNATGG